MSYKTKTQKKNALIAISRKAFKLYESGIMTLSQLDKVNSVVLQARKKL